MNANFSNETWTPIHPVRSNETGRLSSVYDCMMSNVSNSMYTPICVTSVALLGLALLTLVVGVLSAIRIILVSKRSCTVHFNMNLVTIVYLFVLSLYVAYLSSFWLYITYQLLKVSVMYSVVAFLSVSVIRFRVCPAMITQKVALIILSVFFLLPLAPFAYTLVSYEKLVSTVKETDQQFCGDFALLMFASIECGIALTLFIQILLILSLYYHKSSLTAYVTRQSKPIFFLTFSYCATSITHLVIRAWIYLVTRDGKLCHNMNATDTFMWTFLLVTVVHLILPPWTLYWYFYSSIQPRVFSIAPLNFDGTSDDDRTDFDDSDEANEEFNKSFTVSKKWTTSDQNEFESSNDYGQGSFSRFGGENTFSGKYNSYVTR